MTTRNPFLLPSEVADDVSDLLAPGYLLPCDLELLDDVTDEIPVADPIDQPDLPEQEWPSPEQLAAEAGVELPF